MQGVIILKNIFSKLFYQLTSALIDRLAVSIPLVLVINFGVSYLVTPTKNFLAIINTIIRNPYWLVIMLLVILLLIIRFTFIKSINRLQKSQSLYINGNKGDGILDFGNEDYLFRFNVVNEYGCNNDLHIRAIGIQNPWCPICKDDLIEKRSLITGLYKHYCPEKHVSFTNKYSNYTMEQRALKVIERNFNILETAEEQEKYIKESHYF